VLLCSSLTTQALPEPLPHQLPVCHMKRKLCQDELTCSDVRGLGFEVIWHVPNVAQLLQKKLPGIAPQPLLVFHTAADAARTTLVQPLDKNCFVQ
jgi:hypothetical protein